LLVAPYGTETDGELPERANELCYTCHSRLSIDGNQSFPLHREHIRGFRGNAGTVSTRKLATRAEGHAATGGIPKRPGDLRPGGAKSFGAGFGRPTPCATCHDPHGSIQNPALVRFDTSVVRPASVGGPDYRRTGQGHGSCTLTCHGQEHIQARY
jgi:hypothetical protein